MSSLIVVDNPARWDLDIPEVEVVSARTYLTDPRFSEVRKARVFNLCRSFRYQSAGYYVSLLAAARGHIPRPSITTIQDMTSRTLLRFVSQDLDDLIQKNLKPIESREFELSVYFGRSLAKRYDRLSLQLFNLFEAPLLRASFLRTRDRWQLQGVKPLGSNDIPESHRPDVEAFAREYFASNHAPRRRRPVARYDLAILFDPEDPEPPSDERAIQRFVKAAEELGIEVRLVTKDAYARLAEFDALFIRETTAVNHHTYRFARRAAQLGLAVIDDPESIVRCTNKVYMAELFARHGVPAPRTCILHRDNLEEVLKDLGLPCVLKRPDSSFSAGVTKAETEEEFRAGAEQFLETSELVIAQEFLRTDFDWRIGVFEGEPLYACKYHMAPKHWQIMNWKGSRNRYGKVEALPIDHVPKAVVRTALKAAKITGDGLYGVDLKEVGEQVYVIEVNDNPSLEAGYEDRFLGQELYRRIMGGLLRRIERRARGDLRT